MKKNQLNREEEILRDKLNDIEFDFQPGDWTTLEKQLPSSGGNVSWISGKAIIGAAVVVSLTAAWFAIKNDSAPEVAQKESQEVILNEPSRQKAAEAKPEVKPEIKSEEEKEVGAVEYQKSESIIELRESSSMSEGESLASNASPKTAKEDQTESKLEHEKALTDSTPSNDIAADMVKEDQEVEKPAIIGLSAPDRVCQDEYYTVALEMEKELPKGYTIDWYVAGNLMTQGSRISVMKLQDNGLNQFKLVVKNPSGETFESYEKVIETIYLPELDFTYTDLTDPYEDFDAAVRVVPELYESYQWFDEDDQLIGEGASTLLHFDKKGIYDVTLQAESKEGCINTLEKPLNIEANFVSMAPNAFTPLNHDGLNSTFMPEAFKSRNDQFKMQIMSLDGGMVFETNSVLEEWNGRQGNSGQMMPAGQYFWKAIIRNEEGKSRIFSGHIRITP